MIKENSNTGVEAIYSLSGAVGTLTPGSQSTSWSNYRHLKNLIILVSFSFITHSSESCSQVFTIVLVWLMTVVENMPREEWAKIVIGYDNMCHLDALKVAKNPLPLPPPYNEMWLAVTKVYYL